jgi:hypothetical protein
MRLDQRAWHRAPAPLHRPVAPPSPDVDRLRTAVLAVARSAGEPTPALRRVWWARLTAPGAPSHA